MATATLNSLLAARARLEQARQQLVALADDLVDGIDAVGGDVYVAEDQKKLTAQKLKDEAWHALDARLEELEEARESARRLASRVLEKPQATERETASVRRLLDRGVSPTQIMSEARARRSVERLLALRQELADYGDGSQYGQPTTKAAVAKMANAVDRTLAEVAEGDEREEYRQALTTVALAEGAEPARNFASRVVTSGAKDPMGRLSMAFAEGDVERATAPADGADAAES